jgi:hypothetical protein
MTVADDRALFGRANQCPVSGVTQPCRRNLETAEFDPTTDLGPTDRLQNARDTR